MQTKWIEWIKKLQAIAQNGLTYSRDLYDLERYKELQTVIVDIIQNHTKLKPEEIRNFLTNETGYATPKVDVRGVVFQDNKILLVKEKSDGKWTLPGGWADVCESAGENVVKEIAEESGYKTRAVRLLALYDRSKHAHMPEFPFHVYKIFFLCEIIGGSSQSGLETSHVGFFPVAALPELSITRVTPQQIKRMFELYHNKQLPADFD